MTHGDEEPTKPRVLVVDDEPSMRRSLCRILERQGYECVEAADATAAQYLLAGSEFALVLTDVKMPGDSGFLFSDHVFSVYPDTAVVMVTGVGDTSVAATALHRGAYGYVIKPFEASEIVINVANALRRRSLEIENRRYRERLESLVRERTASLESALNRVAETSAALRRSQEEAIQRLAVAAEYHDPSTGAHLRSMSRISELIARSYGLSDEQSDLIRLASPMHDIGKIALAGELLRKPGRLDEEQTIELRRHPEMGYAILAGSESALLDLGASIALSHHERFDGTGYPKGLAATDIPLEGRIVALADVFDALTSERPYKRMYGFDEAMAVVIAERGRHFDPDVVTAFVRIADEVQLLAAGTEAGSFTVRQ